MEPYVAELIGVAAAAASLYSAHAKTMIPLRVAAIVGNILAMAYSFMLGTYPTFMLNAALFALHGWRLRAMLNLIRDIDVAARSNMNVDWLLPYTRPKHFKADDIMMERGEYATAAFYIVSGEVEIVEIKETLLSFMTEKAARRSSLNQDWRDPDENLPKLPARWICC
jgi:hypothetical protein